MSAAAVSTAVAQLIGDSADPDIDQGDDDRRIAGRSRVWGSRNEFTGCPGPASTSSLPGAPELDVNTGRTAAARPLAQTLQEASLAVSVQADPQDVVDAQIALAWAQIKCGDQAGARASLDRAEGASIALEPEERCTPVSGLLRHAVRPVTVNAACNS